MALNDLLSNFRTFINKFIDIHDNSQTAHTDIRNSIPSNTGELSNEIAYNNILAGESTNLTLTDQEKINMAINNKIGMLGNEQDMQAEIEEFADALANAINSEGD